jgi:hypothetical protein
MPQRMHTALGLEDLSQKHWVRKMKESCFLSF